MAAVCGREYLDFYLQLDDGSDDREQAAVDGVRPQLPRLERHVQVEILRRTAQTH